MKQLLSALIILCLKAADAQNLVGMHHMLGYVDMREACIWLQTEEPSNVLLTVYPKNDDQKIVTYSGETKGDYTNTCHIVLNNLEPGTEYVYIISDPENTNPRKEKTILYEFKTQQLWQYRTDPPDFTIATGSCTFVNETEYDRPGKPYGGDYQIFENIAAKKPDMMLWLGDNIYLREVDFASQAGISHRYSHCRAVEEMQNLLHTSANYAIWDDHDFGPNDSNGSFVHKDWTLNAFKTFWANPSYGIQGTCEENGITTQFQWSDIDFFLLDNRFNRVAHDVKNSETPTILGEQQINWLIESLKFSKAPFKIVAMGGQFLNTGKNFENYSNWSTERQRIIEAIESNNIKGVFFLTGDRHCGEFSELKLSNGECIYDLTVSPLTSTAYDITKEENTCRVDGTLVPERNFATLHFSGGKDHRVMTISVFDAQGVLKYEKNINQAKQTCKKTIKQNSDSEISARIAIGFIRISETQNQFKRSRSLSKISSSRYSFVPKSKALI